MTVLFVLLILAYLGSVLDDAVVVEFALTSVFFSLPTLYIIILLFIGISSMLTQEKIISVIAHYCIISLLSVILFAMASVFIGTNNSSLSEHIVQSALTFWNLNNLKDGGARILPLIETIFSTIVHIIFVAIAVNNLKYKIDKHEETEQ